MNLSTEYMGLTLQSPLVPSASPLSREIDAIKLMEDAHAGAVVLFSLFEEQITQEADELEYYLQYGANRFAESLSYFPDEGEYLLGPVEYLNHIQAAKQAVDIPIIASLNGVSDGGWTSYAKQIEQAGADALELNIYFVPALGDVSGEQIEQAYVSALQAVRSAVSIPVAMKLSPFFSSPANIIRTLDSTGANAFVLFNRFYQPDIDIDTLDVKPSLSLSTAFEMRLGLRWIALLRGRITASLAATTGIYTALDVAKMILAGADVTMMCSALLKHGIGHLAGVREDLIHLMESKGYQSISEMKGVLSQAHCPEPSVFERANYLKTLTSYGLTATFE